MFPFYLTNTLGLLPTYQKPSPQWVGSAITAGASLLGGLFTNSQNAKIARETNAMNERLFNTQLDYVKAAEQRSYEYQDKAWQRETEYNSPAAQRARYEQAGLNPALMMQGQNAAVASMGDVSQLGVPSAPQMQGYTAQDIVGPAISSFFESRQAEANIKKADAEASMLGADASVRTMKNNLELANMRADWEAKLSNKSLTDEQRNHVLKQIELIDQEIAFNDATLDSRIKSASTGAYLVDQQGQLVEEQAKEMRIRNKFAEERERLNIKLSNKQIDSIIEGINLTKAQTKTEIAKEAKTILEKNGLEPGTEQYEQMYRFVESQIYNNYLQSDNRGYYLPDAYYDNGNGSKPRPRFPRRHSQ